MPNYLVPALLLTLCCCQPIAIVSMVYAVQANSKAGAGFLDEAMQSANQARIWLFISLALWFLMAGAGVCFALISAALNS